MQPIFQNIVEHWHRLGEFFAFDAALLAEPLWFSACPSWGALGFLSIFLEFRDRTFSLSRLDLQQLRREVIHTLFALLDQPRRLIISILAGNELINVAATINAAGILVALYGEDRAVWISIIVMVPLVLLFGEMMPKTIAVSNPVRSVPRSSRSR